MAPKPAAPPARPRVPGSAVNLVYNAARHVAAEAWAKAEAEGPIDAARQRTLDAMEVVAQQWLDHCATAFEVEANDSPDDWDEDADDDDEEDEEGGIPEEDLERCAELDREAERLRKKIRAELAREDGFRAEATALSLAERQARRVAVHPDPAAVEREAAELAEAQAQAERHRAKVEARTPPPPGPKGAAAPALEGGVRALAVPTPEVTQLVDGNLLQRLTTLRRVAVVRQRQEAGEGDDDGPSQTDSRAPSPKRRTGLLSFLGFG